MTVVLSELYNYMHVFTIVIEYIGVAKDTLILSYGPLVTTCKTIIVKQIWILEMTTPTTYNNFRGVLSIGQRPPVEH